MSLATLLALLPLAGFGPGAWKACETAATGLPEINLLSEAGKIMLTGRVGDEAARKQLADAAARAFGAGNVTDKLAVDSAVGPVEWRANPVDLLKRLKSSELPVAVKINGREAVIEGFASDKQARDGTVGEATAVLGEGVKLKDELTVQPPLPARQAEPAAPPPRAEATPPAPADGLVRFKLPDGNEIAIADDGLESKLLGFLIDKARVVDKGVWFDFDRLQFKTGSSSLTPESKLQIDTLAAILKAYPSAAVKIGGYTDNVGDAGANLKLSATRAERVAAELASLGIAADRLEAEGYGEQHPIADNATAEGRAKNRRTALSVRRK